MDVLTFVRKDVGPSTFEFPALGLRAEHKAIDTLTLLAARNRAGEYAGRVRDGLPVLAMVGVDTEEGPLTQLDQGGLTSFFVAVEVWLLIVTKVTILTPDGEKSAPMEAGQVYTLFAAEPRLYLAWEEHTQRHMVSASEGNAFALLPATDGAGAPNDAGTAVH